jgi:preprotein translocase SecE subunit
MLAIINRVNDYINQERNENNLQPVSFIADTDHILQEPIAAVIACQHYLSNSNNIMVIDLGGGKYRYLTERECWRLQGYSDADFEAAKAVKKQVKPVKKSDGKKNIFARIGGYFKGAWYELRQVRWPNRKATWGLTLAVILFSVFFTVLIVLLDILFKYIFELIIA